MTAIDNRGDSTMERHQTFRLIGLSSVLLMAIVILLGILVPGIRSQPTNNKDKSDESTVDNAVQLVNQGKKIFRFDTFGDQAFWGDTLKLHQAIEGSGSGGVGPGVSPKTALTVGLKVDIDALPSNLVEQVQHGQVNLNDPAVTVALLKLNAVVGV